MSNLQLSNPILQHFALHVNICIVVEQTAKYCIKPAITSYFYAFSESMLIYGLSFNVTGPGVTYNLLGSDRYKLMYIQAYLVPKPISP